MLKRPARVSWGRPEHRGPAGPDPVPRGADDSGPGGRCKGIFGSSTCSPVFLTQSNSCRLLDESTKKGFNTQIYTIPGGLKTLRAEMPKRPTLFMAESVDFILLPECIGSGPRVKEAVALKVCSPDTTHSLHVVPGTPSSSWSEQLHLQEESQKAIL